MATNTTGINNIIDKQYFMHSSSNIKAYLLFLPLFPYNKIRAPDLQQSVQLTQYNKFLLLHEKSNLTFHFMKHTDVWNKLQANTHTSTTQQNLNPQRYVCYKRGCNYYIPWNLITWSKSKNKIWQQFQEVWIKLIQTLHSTICFCTQCVKTNQTFAHFNYNQFHSRLLYHVSV